MVQAQLFLAIAEEDLNGVTRLARVKHTLSDKCASQGVSPE
jgi:hypothetical protein